MKTNVGNHSLSHNGKLVIGALCATVGLPTCVTAVAVTAVVSVRTRTNPLPLLREIGWSTLALVAGLFVMVDAVESSGAVNYT